MSSKVGREGEMSIKCISDPVGGSVFFLGRRCRTDGMRQWKHRKR